MRNIIRPVVLGFTVLVGAIGVVPASAGATGGVTAVRAVQAVPPPMSEPHHRVTVKLVKVRCSNTEDWTGNDELIVAYNISGHQQRLNEQTGQYEYHRVVGEGFTPEKSVSNRSWAKYDKGLFDAKVGSSINVDIIITMVEKDHPDKWDILGKVKLSQRPIDMPLGTKAYSQRFRPGGSDYTVYYEITNELVQ